MLQNLVHFIIISCISVLLGWPLVFFQQKKNNETIAVSADSLIMSFFCGLALLAIFSSWMSLFFPLRISILFSVTVPVAILSIWLFKKSSARIIVPALKAYPVHFLFLLLVCILFFILGSNRPVMEDTDLYHLQIIRLNREQGLVTGIANLYPRYGFYSCWLQLISFFYIPFKNENFLFLNLTAGCWFCFFLVRKIIAHQSQAKPESKILLVFYLLVLLYMFLEWDLFRANSSSTGYDFIVTALTIIVLSQITENFFFQRRYNEWLIILLAVSVPFFKLSGGPFLFILGIYFLMTPESWKIRLTAILIFAIFAIPFFIKNYYQTGYVLYPYTFIDPFSPDWKVPGDIMKNFVNYLSSSNKYLNQAPRMFSDYDPASLHWVRGWPARLVLTDKLLLCFAAASLPLSFFIKNKNYNYRKLLTIYYATLLSLLVWFFSAPDPRFVYGSLMFCGFIIVSFFIARFIKKFMVNLALVILSICICIYGSRKIDLHNLITTASVYYPAYQKIMIHGAEYNLPRKINNNWNIRCYNVPLPCIYQFNPYLEPRGQSIKDGFRMKPITDSNFIINYNY